MSVPPQRLLTGSKVEDMLGVPERVGGLTGDTVLAQGTGHLQGQGAAHPALAPGGRFCGLWRLRSGPGLQDQGLGAWAEVKRKWSVEVEGGEDTIRGPLRGLGFGEGQRRVPYAAAQLAPAEFGLRVATGIADQGDFISFGPTAFDLGLSLLCL